MHSSWRECLSFPRIKGISQSSTRAAKILEILDVVRKTKPLKQQRTSQQHGNTASAATPYRYGTPDAGAKEAQTIRALACIL